MLFTIDFEYKGGTYLAQVDVSGPGEAVIRWLEGISDEELELWKVDRAAMADAFEDEVPVIVQGLRGVWCVATTLKDALALVNIVATVATR